MHPAFDGLDYRPDGNYFPREVPGVAGIQLRGHVTQDGVTISVGHPGPRGGFAHRTLGGSHNDLQLDQLLVARAQQFWADLDWRRREWLA